MREGLILILQLSLLLLAAAQIASPGDSYLGKGYDITSAITFPTKNEDIGKTWMNRPVLVVTSAADYVSVPVSLVNPIQYNVTQLIHPDQESSYTIYGDIDGDFTSSKRDLSIGVQLKGTIQTGYSKYAQGGTVTLIQASEIVSDLTLKNATINPLFLADAYMLPDNYTNSIEDRRKFFSFFSKYGTHFVSRVQLGAFYNVEATQTWTSGISLGATITLAGEVGYSLIKGPYAKASGSIDGSLNYKRTDYVDTKKFYAGGVLKWYEKRPKLWRASIAQNPVAVKVQYESYVYLFNTTQRQQTLQTALKYYFSYAAKADIKIVPFNLTQLSVSYQALFTHPSLGTVYSAQVSGSPSSPPLTFANKIGNNQTSLPIFKAISNKLGVDPEYNSQLPEVTISPIAWSSIGSSGGNNSVNLNRAICPEGYVGLGDIWGNSIPKSYPYKCVHLRCVDVCPPATGTSYYAKVNNVYLYKPLVNFTKSIDIGSIYAYGSSSIVSSIDAANVFYCLRSLCYLSSENEYPSVYSQDYMNKLNTVFPTYAETGVGVTTLTSSKALAFDATPTISMFAFNRYTQIEWEENALLITSAVFSLVPICWIVYWVKYGCCC